MGRSPGDAFLPSAPPIMGGVWQTLFPPFPACAVSVRSCHRAPASKRREQHFRDETHQHYLGVNEFTKLYERAGILVNPDVSCAPIVARRCERGQHAEPAALRRAETPGNNRNKVCQTPPNRRSPEKFTETCSFCSRQTEPGNIEALSLLRTRPQKALKRAAGAKAKPLRISPNGGNAPAGIAPRSRPARRLRGRARAANRSEAPSITLRSLAVLLWRGARALVGLRRSAGVGFARDSRCALLKEKK